MKIAIAGFGVEGAASYKYWSRDESNDVTIVDEQAGVNQELPSGAATMFGPNAFKHLEGFDMVVRTAGLAPFKINTNGKVWSATNEFFARCPAPIIGVTGSKGKGTTASLIASILEADGRKVWLVGNIGKPSLDILDQISAEDIVIYELSSFQLWDIEKSPQTAVVLFIEREHLDVHRSMEEYVEAKSQITRYQTAEDVLIYNANNSYAAAIAEASEAQKIGYPSEAQAHIEDGYFYYGDQQLCSVEQLSVTGAHNQENALAAINAAWRYTQEPQVFAAGLANFKGLPHRLSFVKNVNGVDYYDDSIATTPASAIAALRAFPDRSKVIILGGSYKGSDYSELGIELTKHQARAILIGDEAERIAKACTAAGFNDFEIIPNATAELFTERAAELAQHGGVVLLSPASASFGLFKNYIERGEQFIAAVNNL